MQWLMVSTARRAYTGAMSQSATIDTSLRQRRWLIAATLVLAILPWMGGGKAPLALGLTSAVALLALLLGQRLPLRWYHGRVIIGAYAALLGWSALSLIWSVNRFDTERWLIDVILMGVIFQFAYQLRSRKGAVTWWWSMYRAVAVAVALYGLGLFLFGDYERLTSLFYWPNPAAIWLLPAVLYGIWRTVVGSNRWEAIPTAITATALYLTFSRSAYGLLALALIAAVLVAWRRGLKPAWLSLLALVVLTAALIAGTVAIRPHLSHGAQVTASERFTEAATGSSTSLSDRANYLKASYNIWENYALLGSGGGTFGSVHPAYQQKVVSAGASAHNSYAQAFAELGLVGGVALLVLAIALLVEALQAIRQRRGGVAAIALVIMLIHLGVDIDALYPPVLLLMASLAGLVVASRDSRPSTNRVTTLNLSVALIVAITLSMSWLATDKQYQNGKIYQENGEFALAATSYADAQKGLMYNPDAITAAGILNYTQAFEVKGDERQQKLDTALNDANRAIKEDARDAQHHFLKARVLRAQGQQAAAIVAYQQALRLDPYNHPDYYLDLADLYLIQKQPARAQQLLTAAINQYDAATIVNRSTVASFKPQVIQLYLMRARSEGDQGNTVAALRDVAIANALNR